MVKTYGDLYQDTRRALARQAPPQDPGVLARLLVCQASGKTQAQFLADRDLYAGEKIVAEVEENLRRLLADEPIAYVLGQWEFYGLPMLVSPKVLIPRDDPCALTELAIRQGLFLEQDPRILDLCCGSGTAMEAAQSLGCRFVGVDKSPEAILTTASRLECSDLTIDCPCTMDETPLEGEYNGHGGMLLLTGFHAAHPSFPKTEQQLDTLESWSVGKITPEGLQVMQRFRRSRKQPELPWFCVLPEGCGDIAVSTVDAAGRKRVYRWKD